MRLRPRLALTTLAVSVPMVVGFVWWDAFSKRQAAEEELIEFTHSLAESPGWLEGCEADPRQWGGRPQGPGGGPPPFGSREPQGPPPPHPAPGPGFRPFAHSRPATFFAYGADLKPRHPSAPSLPPHAQETIRNRDAVSLTPPWQNTTVRVLLRTPGEPRECIFVLAEGTTEPWLGSILPPTHVWLLPLLAMWGSVLVTAGPIVARIRGLTTAARRSAVSQYESGVSTSGSDEITELAVALDEASQRVRSQVAETRRSEEALREFLANTTHDIMVPLTVLQGYLSELGEAEKGNYEANGQALAAAMSEAHYIGALVHNLAIAATLDTDAPTIERTEVDLAALVERVVSRHRPIARSLAVSIDRAVPAAPMRARADVTLIEQAVSNLVHNAVRYNRSGGHVAVIVESDGESGFVLRVIDDGPGIADGDVAQAIRRGFRGDAARTRAPDGRGLGLNIAQRVAELHGFQLRFARSEYGGLEVSLKGTREHPGSSGLLSN